MDEFIFNLDVDDSAVQKKIAAILNKIEEANPSLNINTDGIENKIKSLISKIKSDFSSGSINAKDLINFGTLIRESDKFTDSLKTDISDIINMLSNIENVSLNKQLKSDLKNVSTELKNSSVKDFLDFDIKEAKSKIQKLKKEIRSVPDELLDTRSSVQEAFGVDLSKVVSSKDSKLLRDRKSLVDLFDESEGTLSDDLFYQYLLDMEEIKQRGIELDESIRKSDERLKKRYVLENSQKKYDDIYNDAKNSISEEQNWKNFVNQKKEDIKKIQSQIDEYQKRVENKDSSSSSRTKKSNYTNRNSDAVDSSSTLNAQQHDSLNISSLQNAVDNLASTVEGATKKISVAVSDLNSEKKQKSDTVSEYRASDLLTNDEKTNYNESIASFETAEGKVSSYKEKLLELKRTYEELNRITASNELIDKKSFESTEKKVADLKKIFSSLSKELSSDKFDISEDIKSNYNETIVSQQKANDKLKSLYEREKEYFLYDKNPNGSLLSKKEKEYELAYTKFEKLKKEADKYNKESGYFDSTYREVKDEINKVQMIDRSTLEDKTLQTFSNGIKPFYMVDTGTAFYVACEDTEDDISWLFGEAPVEYYYINESSEDPLVAENLFTRPSKFSYSVSTTIVDKTLLRGTSSAYYMNTPAGSIQIETDVGWNEFEDGVFTVEELDGINTMYLYSASDGSKKTLVQVNNGNALWTVIKGNDGYYYFLDQAESGVGLYKLDIGTSTKTLVKEYNEFNINLESCGVANLGSTLFFYEMPNDNTLDVKYRYTIY